MKRGNEKKKKTREKEKETLKMTLFRGETVFSVLKSKKQIDEEGLEPSEARPLNPQKKQRTKTKKKKKKLFNYYQ